MQIKVTKIDNESLWYRYDCHDIGYDGDKILIREDNSPDVVAVFSTNHFYATENFE